MRKHYIDNLRWICILLLFPFHTCMIFNDFGENFYIKMADNQMITNFLHIINPWFMPLLFVLAGISTRYALLRRSNKQYIKERFIKLFIPLVFGILLIVPVQTYYAERFHNNYTGGYLEQYKLFFGEIDDLTGYSGGFTPAHLWFILYLFLISVAALLVINMFKKFKSPKWIEKLTIPKIIPMFLIFTFMSLILDIGGKSLGEFFALFMLGYYILSQESIQNRLENARWFLAAGFGFITILNIMFIRVFDCAWGVGFDFFINLVTWIGILTFIGLGKHFLEFHNGITDYFSKASFPVYILHQSVLIMTAYYVTKYIDFVVAQYFIIMIISFVVTIMIYQVVKKFSVTRFMFGIK